MTAYSQKKNKRSANWPVTVYICTFSWVRVKYFVPTSQSHAWLNLAKSGLVEQTIICLFSCVTVTVWLEWKHGPTHTGPMRIDQTVLTFEVVVIDIVLTSRHHQCVCPWGLDRGSTNLLGWLTAGVLWHSVQNDGLPSCTPWWHCNCGGS